MELLQKFHLGFFQKFSWVFLKIPVGIDYSRNSSKNSSRDSFGSPLRILPGIRFGIIPGFLLGTPSEFFFRTLRKFSPDFPGIFPKISRNISFGIPPEIALGLLEKVILGFLQKFLRKFFIDFFLINTGESTRIFSRIAFGILLAFFSELVPPETLFKKCDSLKVFSNYCCNFFQTSCWDSLKNSCRYCTGDSSRNPFKNF